MFDVIKDYNKDKGEGFTLAVVIDDLDRCPTDKIMLILQAMHLLLEQPDAPMAAFLAVDPRIICLCHRKRWRASQMRYELLAVHPVHPARMSSTCIPTGFVIHSDRLFMPSLVKTRGFSMYITKSVVVCPGICPGIRTVAIALLLCCRCRAFVEEDSFAGKLQQQKKKKFHSFVHRRRRTKSSQVNGLKYLDKIVHVPFCIIPRIEEKVCRDYVSNLLNLEASRRETEKKTVAEEAGEGKREGTEDNTGGDGGDSVEDGTGAAAGRTTPDSVVRQRPVMDEAR